MSLQKQGFDAPESSQPHDFVRVCVCVCMRVRVRVRVRWGALFTEGLTLVRCEVVLSD